MSVSFERSHDILIDAPPRAVFDYVTNPQSWPEWIKASHRIDSEDRPLTRGETFHETWRIRSGEVPMNWVVEACDSPKLWIVQAETAFMGPIVIQYTFGNTPSRTAAELEFQLNWYDSRPEFADLVAAARALAEEDPSDDRLGELASELIRRVGAFPDRSIISTYRQGPTLQELPDYIVACTIEEIVCDRDPSS